MNYLTGYGVDPPPATQGVFDKLKAWWNAKSTGEKVAYAAGGALLVTGVVMAVRGSKKKGYKANGRKRMRRNAEKKARKPQTAEKRLRDLNRRMGEKIEDAHVAIQRAYAMGAVPAVNEQAAKQLVRDSAQDLGLASQRLLYGDTMAARALLQKALARVGLSTEMPFVRGGESKYVEVEAVDARGRKVKRKYLRSAIEGTGPLSPAAIEARLAAMRGGPTSSGPTYLFPAARATAIAARITALDAAIEAAIDQGREGEAESMMVDRQSLVEQLAEVRSAKPNGRRRRARANPPKLSKEDAERLATELIEESAKRSEAFSKMVAEARERAASLSPEQTQEALEEAFAGAGVPTTKMRGGAGFKGVQKMRVRGGGGGGAGYVRAAGLLAEREESKLEGAGVTGLVPAWAVHEYGDLPIVRARRMGPARKYPVSFQTIQAFRTGLEREAPRAGETEYEFTRRTGIGPEFRVVPIGSATGRRGGVRAIRIPEMAPIVGYERVPAEQQMLAEDKEAIGYAEGRKHGMVIPTSGYAAEEWKTRSVSRRRDPYSFGFKRGVMDSLFLRGGGRPSKGPIPKIGRAFTEGMEPYEGPIEGSRVRMIEPPESRLRKGAAGRRAVDPSEFVLTFRKNRRKKGKRRSAA